MPPYTALFALCHCEPVTDVTGVAIRIPSHGTCGHAFAEVLSSNSGRKCPKNAVKTKVLKSFRA